MPNTRHSVLAAVELLVDSGRSPAETTGTVVEADNESALVEISNDRGHTLDFIAVPQGTLAAHGDARRWNEQAAKQTISTEPW